MAKQVIKIGTKVAYRPNGSRGGVSFAHVTYIEECECGEKYGESVDSVDFKLRAGDFANGVEYTFSLDDGHWCHGEQIIRIVEE